MFESILETILDIIIIRRFTDKDKDSKDPQDSKVTQKKKIKRFITYGLLVLFLGLTFFDDAPGDFKYLTSPHVKTYPSSVNVDRPNSLISTITYTYLAGDKEFDGVQAVYFDYLWVNKLFPTTKQYQIVYLRDDPSSSRLLADIYLSLTFKFLIFIVIIGLILLIRYLVRYFKNKATKPETNKTDPINIVTTKETTKPLSQDDDIIKRR